jgi:hypothetical protein
MTFTNVKRRELAIRGVRMLSIGLPGRINKHSHTDLRPQYRRRAEPPNKYRRSRRSTFVLNMAIAPFASARGGCMAVSALRRRRA